MITIKNVNNGSIFYHLETVNGHWIKSIYNEVTNEVYLFTDIAEYRAFVDEEEEDD